jgi:hypothetical protein
MNKLISTQNKVDNNNKKKNKWCWNDPINVQIHRFWALLLSLKTLQLQQNILFHFRKDTHQNDYTRKA